MRFFDRGLVVQAIYVFRPVGVATVVEEMHPIERHRRLSPSVRCREERSIGVSLAYPVLCMMQIIFVEDCWG